MKHGKKYEAALKLIDTTKVYDLHEACELIGKTSTTSFDATVGISFKLNINTKKADQQVRGTVILPNGSGKTVRVLALTTKTEEALAAGADYAGSDDMLDKIINEKWFDFDKICATPDMMAKIGKAARILGPKGLMPNPKTGTVGPDIAKMIKELKAGKVEYRADRDSNVNLRIGKVSFTPANLEENAQTVIKQILKVRPATVKGKYVLSCNLSTTMGPSIKIALGE